MDRWINPRIGGSAHRLALIGETLGVQSRFAMSPSRKRLTVEKKEAVKRGKYKACPVGGDWPTLQLAYSVHTAQGWDEPVARGDALGTLRALGPLIIISAAG
jgi:hypothetical protein